MYSVIDLGEWVHPYDVNNQGVVCGMFYDKTTFRAFVWTAAIHDGAQRFLIDNRAPEAHG